MKHFRAATANGVPAPQHQRNGGLFHAGDELGDGQTGLHIAAGGVQKDEQAVDVVAFLDGGQHGQHVLVLGGLGLAGQHLVSLDVTDDGQTVDGVLSPGDHTAQVLCQIVHEKHLPQQFAREKQKNTSAGEVFSVICSIF